MRSTSVRRRDGVRAILFASTLAIATQAWSPGVDGFSPTDDPSSPYYLGQIAPPAWQGRPYAIPGLGE